MKIWVKIAILVFIVTNFTLEIVLYFIKDEITKEYTSLEGRNLQTLATTISTSIDGEYFKMIDFTDTSKVYKNPHYLSLQNSLKNIKKNLNLPQEIYTLSMIDSNRAIFGIMTNEVPFTGDTLELKSDVAKTSLLQIYRTKKSMHTNIYDDQYGMWISGLAPIIDNEGNVVGVVQADHESSYVLAEIDKHNKHIIYFSLILIPFIVLLSIAVSKFISKPITQLTKAVDNISKGNYKKVENIKATGELKQLVDSTNRMRETILEQQEKIQETIRELTDSNKELKISKKEAEGLSRLKSNFLAIMSHELRTPLIGILGFAEIIYEEVKSPELSRLAGLIMEDQNRLLTTINELLDLSLIVSNKNELFLECNNVNVSVKQAIEIQQPLADKKGLSIKTNFSANEINILTDEKLLFRIVSNVINNGIKFTENGSVTIETSIEVRNSKKYGVISVIDNGIGIPKDCLKYIFKDFRQVSEGLSRRYEGVGLGLTIVKEFTELMKGFIEIKSEVNKGTTVKIFFPLSKAKSGKILTNKNKELEHTRKKEIDIYFDGPINILVVEDNELNVNVIKRFLKDKFIITHCFDGNSALKKVNEKNYDLIIMDINLKSELDGMQTANKIKEIERYRKIPIVALTAYAFKSEKKQILESACTHYISKPFNKQTLISTIYNALECYLKETIS